MKSEHRSLFSLTLAMFIFGTIGIFRHYIPYPSGFIAFVRGAVGVVFLLLFMLITHKKISWKALRRNLALLIVSGALIGFNWILLFDSFNYISVPTATVCYNTTPIFLIIASPFVLHEKPTAKKLLCVGAALVGILLVSGIFEVGFGEGNELRGILCGLGAALLYCTAVLLNKKLKDISAYETTLVQLAAAAVVVLPYTLFAEGEALSTATYEPLPLILLFAMGILHTGIAYALYFGSLGGLRAQTVAIFSYVDPAVAILLSALILGENLTPLAALGTVLILGGALASELEFKQKKKEP